MYIFLLPTFSSNEIHSSLFDNSAVSKVKSRQAEEQLCQFSIQCHRSISQIVLNDSHGMNVEIDRQHRIQSLHHGSSPQHGFLLPRKFISRQKKTENKGRKRERLKIGELWDLEFIHVLNSDQKRRDYCLLCVPWPFFGLPFGTIQLETFILSQKILSHFNNELTLLLQKTIQLPVLGQITLSPWPPHLVFLNFTYPSLYPLTKISMQTLCYLFFNT